MSNEVPTVRTGQGSTRLSRSEFEHLYRAQFVDPAFDAAAAEVERLTTIAWEAYEDSRKSPHSRKAGPEFADPEHELPLEWLDWLTDMELVPAGAAAVFDRYIGYHEPYATSHEALDRDTVHGGGEERCTDVDGSRDRNAQRPEGAGRRTRFTAPEVIGSPSIILSP